MAYYPDIRNPGDGPLGFSHVLRAGDDPALKGFAELQPGADFGGFHLTTELPRQLIFDEPESALSIIGQFAFLRLLKEWAVTGHTQLIIATHFPFLLAVPGATIYSFDYLP